MKCGYPLIASNLDVTPEGHLTFAGADTAALAKKYGTPLYLMDEERIRANCRLYTKTLREELGGRALALYAGKAASFRAIYPIIQDEGMGADVVSQGEIYTAFISGFPMEKTYFHGSNKTGADIAFAMDHGVGCIIADGRDELQAIQREASLRGRVQSILLRLTPGIDPHTYEAVNTGRVDSKFGTPIETGQALELTRFALSLPNLRLLGFHCHVGSQVFEEDVFQQAGLIMLRFMAEVRQRLGFVTRVYDMGGGYGVRYAESDGEVDIPRRLREVCDFMNAEAEKLGLELPVILAEPGRSIVADAGMTLYTVGAVKDIPGFRSYISVDGGMTDNPRYALYRAKYTAYPAAKMHQPPVGHSDLVGRCCESGDIIQPHVPFPKMERGDLVAVCTTGAYNYSMASNYNRICRPPIVMLYQGKDRLAVRRESLEDIVRNDL